MGGPSKNVVLQASFVNFESVHLKTSLESASRITDNPMLHIFWTSCLVSMFLDPLTSLPIHVLSFIHASVCNS